MGDAAEQCLDPPRPDIRVEQVEGRVVGKRRSRPAEPAVRLLAVGEGLLGLQNDAQNPDEAEPL